MRGSCAGGIVGHLCYGTIENCYNEATVIGYGDYVGGSGAVGRVDRGSMSN